MGTKPRQARFESKVRYSPELYYALQRYSEQHNQSFQSTLEAALRLLFEREQGKRGSDVRALCQFVRDQIEAMWAAPGSMERRLLALERHVAGILGEEPLDGVPADPVAAYVTRIMDEPADEAEAALAALLRAMAGR